MQNYRVQIRLIEYKYISLNMNGILKNTNKNLYHTNKKNRNYKRHVLLLTKITTLIFKHIGIYKKEIVQIHFHIV